MESCAKRAPEWTCQSFLGEYLAYEKISSKGRTWLVQKDLIAPMLIPLLKWPKGRWSIMTEGRKGDSNCGSQDLTVHTVSNGVVTLPD